MNLETIVTNYGYSAVLIGSFLEGKCVLVIVCFFAHSGYFIILAFIGIFLEDQISLDIGSL